MRTFWLRQNTCRVWNKMNKHCWTLWLTFCRSKGDELSLLCWWWSFQPIKTSKISKRATTGSTARVYNCLKFGMHFFRLTDKLKSGKLRVRSITSKIQQFKAKHVPIFHGFDSEQDKSKLNRKTQSVQDKISNCSGKFSWKTLIIAVRVCACSLGVSVYLSLGVMWISSCDCVCVRFTLLQREFRASSRSSFSVIALTKLQVLLVKKLDSSRFLRVVVFRFSTAVEWCVL